MAKLWIPVAAIISGALLVLGFFLGVQPQLSAMSSANEQRESVEQTNRQHEARLAQLKADFEKLDEYREELAALQKELPPGDQLRNFVGQLDRLERSSGVTLTRLTTSEGEPYLPAVNAIYQHASVSAENFVVVPVEVEVVGTRAQVIEFVNLLQRNERIYLVNKLNIAESNDASEEEEYTGSLSGYVYVLVDPTAPPPSPTPPQDVNVSTEANADGE